MGFGVNNNKRNINYNAPSSGDEDAFVNAASATLSVGGKKIKLLKKNIKKTAKKYARIAKKIGSTADEDQFCEQMTEDIFEIFKSLEQENTSQHQSESL